jgi:hypothetical protein
MEDETRSPPKLLPECLNSHEPPINYLFIALADAYNSGRCADVPTSLLRVCPGTTLLIKSSSRTAAVSSVPRLKTKLAQAWFNGFRS